MTGRGLVALGALLALAACSKGLGALTEQDKASFAGFTCTAVKDGRVVYITDGTTGLVRYNGRLVTLARFRTNLPFDPRDTDSLMMASADDSFELSFRGIVQPPGTVNETPQGYRRQVMLTVENRGFGGGRFNTGADLVCDRLPPAGRDEMIIDVNELFGNKS